MLSKQKRRGSHKHKQNDILELEGANIKEVILIAVWENTVDSFFLRAECGTIIARYMKLI